MPRYLAVVPFLLLAAPAGAHEWYSGLISPSGESCCNDQDCRPVDFRYDPRSGRMELRIDGVWAPVDGSKVLSMPSADGGAHACYVRRWNGNRMTPMFRCIILPGEA